MFPLTGSSAVAGGWEPTSATGPRNTRADMSSSIDVQVARPGVEVARPRIDEARPTQIDVSRPPPPVQPMMNEVQATVSVDQVQSVPTQSLVDIVHCMGQSVDPSVLFVLHSVFWWVTHHTNVSTALSSS